MTRRGEDLPVVTAGPDEEPERCSCEEALALRARLAEVTAVIERVRALATNEGLTPHQRWEKILAALSPAPVQSEPERKYICHAGRDGDCAWKLCPQRDNRQSHCPLDVLDDEDQPIAQPLPGPAQATPVVALHLHEARIGTLEVQLRDTRRQLVTAMEQARAAEKKASRLSHELEQARAGKA